MLLYGCFVRNLEDRFCVDCFKTLSRYNRSVRCNKCAAKNRVKKYPKNHVGLPIGFKHSRKTKIKISKSKILDGEWDGIRVENPEYKRMRNRKRRVKKINNGGSHTVKEWEQLKKRYNYKCVACRKKIFLTQDHIVPLSLGGSDDISNIQPLCKSCNSKKSNKIIKYE